MRIYLEVWCGTELPKQEMHLQLKQPPLKQASENRIDFEI